MSDGKKRTDSQRIGRKGESQFSTWAADMHLTTNKSEEDLGVDFFCQLLSTDGTVSGPTLAVQVKSTERESEKRIKLDRDDAATLIRLEQPCCIIGIDLTTNDVRFCFLDTALYKKLQRFLDSTRKSWSLAFSKLEKDPAAFRTQLERITSPGYQQKMRLTREESVLQSIIPNSKITIRATSKRVAPLVRLPWLIDAFDIDPARRDDVAQSILIDGQIPSHTMPGLSMKPVLRSVHRLGDGEGFYVKGLHQRTTRLTVNYQDVSPCTTVNVRTFDGSIAWATATGLVIVSGPAIHGDDGWQHLFQCNFTEHCEHLGESPEELAFLRALHPGALFNFGNDQTVNVWEPIDRIGEMVEALELICKTAGISLSKYKLIHLLEGEFRLSLMVLDAIARGAELQNHMSGFVLGPAARSLLNPSIGGWYEIPIVANLRDQGIVVWVRGRCLLSSVDGAICGFQPVSQIQARWEVRDRLNTGGRPQIWVAAEWPAIDLINGPPEGPIEPASHELGGNVWVDSPHAGVHPSMPAGW